MGSVVRVRVRVRVRVGDGGRPGGAVPCPRREVKQRTTAYCLRTTAYVLLPTYYCLRTTDCVLLTTYY